MRDKIVNIVMWLVASLISLMALGILIGPTANNILGFFIVLVSAIMFTPLIQKVVRVKTKKELKPEIYLLTGCLLFLVGVTASIGNNEQIIETNEKIKTINEKNGLSGQDTDIHEFVGDNRLEEDAMKVKEVSQTESIAEDIVENVDIEQTEPVIENTTSGNKESIQSGVVSKSTDIDFATCMQQQNEMTAMLLSSGNYRVIPIVQTGFLSIVRFCTNDGSVLHTCSEEDGKMVVTMSPNQEGC